MEKLCNQQPVPPDPDPIVKSAWEAAARRNPMLLAKLEPSTNFSELRQMVRKELESGLPPPQVEAKLVNQLLALYTTEKSQ
jgi:hypothetical protein